MPANKRNKTPTLNRAEPQQPVARNNIVPTLPPRAIAAIIVMLVAIFITYYLHNNQQHQMLVFGFLPEWKLDQADFPLYCGIATHIILFSIELDANTGALRELNRLPSHDRLQDIRKNMTKGCQLMFAVGGAGRSAGFAAIRNEDKLEAAASALARLAWDEQFDGIELNWQFPQALDDFMKFQKFGASIKRHWALLSGGSQTTSRLILTSAIPSSPEFIRAVQASNLVNSFDYFHIMCYLDGIGGPDAVKRAEKSMQTVQKMLPSHTITMGIPFYGTSPSGDAHSYEHMLIHLRFKKVSYENAPTIRQKIRSVRQLGIAGLSIWELGSDCRVRAVKTHVATCRNANESLIDNIRRELLQLP